MSSDTLDSDSLRVTLRHCSDHRSLARAACVCKFWRAASASCWAAAHSRAFGRHSTCWAPVLESAPDDRARVMMRTKAAEMRRAGLCHHRILPFELGPTPETSPFFMSSMSVDGAWVGIGEFSGLVSLWDMRTGRRLWRCEQMRGAGEVSDLHVDAVAGLVAVVWTGGTLCEEGLAGILRTSDGASVAVVSHDRRTMEACLEPGAATVPTLPWAGLHGTHVYTGARLLSRPREPLPWRLATVALVDEAPPGADEAPRNGVPVCCLWQPATGPGVARDAPSIVQGLSPAARADASVTGGGEELGLRLLRTSDPGALITEQAGVVAEATLQGGEVRRGPTGIPRTERKSCRACAILLPQHPVAGGLGVPNAAPVGSVTGEPQPLRSLHAAHARRDRAAAAVLGRLGWHRLFADPHDLTAGGASRPRLVGRSPRRSRA